MNYLLSERARTVLRFIRDYQQGHGYAPALREIMTACAISSTSVTAAVMRRLRAGGFIEYDPIRARTVRLTEKGVGAVEHGR